MKATDLDHAVDRFLRTGSVSAVDAAELAGACDRRVRAATQKSNRLALRLGRKYVERARAYGGVLLVTALRACGWATLVAGRYSEAEQCYLEARTLLRRDALARARIDRVLIDVYMYLGRPAESGRRARQALAVFRRLKAPADVAKTQVNYANVLHRQDRHAEAGRLYRRAADFFTASKEAYPTALCYYNLANTRVQLFDFDEATTFYAKAREIFDEHDDRLHAMGCRYGQAWLDMLAGDFHRALRELTACEEFYRQGHQLRELLLCQLDRAETYLALNLNVDARRTAEAALRTAERLGLKYEAAKARLFAGRASVALGRKSDGKRVLQRAAESFRQESNTGFEAATELSLAQTVGDEKGRRELLKTASLRFEKSQLPLWQAVCDLHLLSDGAEDSAVHRRLARNRAVAAVPHLYAGWHTLRGDREAARRRWEAARNFWARAANALDAVRAKLPPVEMRQAYLRRASDPFVRLIDAEFKRSPATASAWSERYKTAGLWSVSADVLAASPQRRRIDKNLEELAARFAASSGLIPETGGRRGSATTPVRPQQARLQKILRDRLAELESGTGRRLSTTGEVARLFAAESKRLPIVQFHVGPEDIFAFVHDRGQTHAHRFVGGTHFLEELVALWRFLVECASYAAPGKPAVSPEDERDILGRIGSWLLPPLELPSRAGGILILPEGPLVSLPWAALCTGGECLIDRFDLVLAPSLRHHVSARRGKSRGDAIRIFVGAHQGLEHVESEVAALRARLPAERTVLYDPCHRADWPDSGESRIWHFSGHAVLRADNPFYSALLGQDGPMFAADFRLRRHSVDLVTLAACRTGQHTSLPGDEATGMVRSLLEMGARNVIASHWAVADRSTARWMDHVYGHYLGGASVSRAVRLAAQQVREEYPSVYHWGAFSTFGCG